MGHIPCIPIACSEMSGSHSEMMTPSDMHGWDLWAGFRIQFKWKYKTLRLHQCLTLNICCDVMEVFLVFGCLVKQGTGEGARRGTQANKICKACYAPFFELHLSSVLGRTRARLVCYVLCYVVLGHVLAPSNLLSTLITQQAGYCAVGWEGKVSPTQHN